MTLLGTFATTTATAIVLWLWFGLGSQVLVAWYLSSYVILALFVLLLALRFPSDVIESR